MRLSARSSTPSPVCSAAGPKTPSSRRTRAHQAGDPETDQQKRPDPTQVQVDAARPVEEEQDAEHDEQHAGDEGAGVRLPADHRGSTGSGGLTGSGGVIGSRGETGDSTISAERTTSI